MVNLNSVTVGGLIGKMSDLVTLQGDNKVLEIRLAIQRDYPSKERPGEYVDHTTWVDVKMFGKLAARVQRKCKVGSRIYVHGFLRTDEWKDKETQQTRSRLWLVAQNIESEDFFQPNGDSKNDTAADETPQAEPAKLDAEGQPVPVTA